MMSPWNLPALFATALLAVGPALSFYFFIRLCEQPFSWLGGAAYLAFSTALLFLSSWRPMPGILSVLAEIALLAVCGGMTAGRRRASQSLALAALVVSVVILSNGISQSLGYLLARFWGRGHEWLLLYLDAAVRLLALLLAILFFLLAQRTFRDGGGTLKGAALYLLTFPVLFLTLSEQIAADAIYGDTVVWDRDEGLLYPLVDSSDILILHLAACLCLASLLAAYRHLAKSVRVEQANRLLEQQNHLQDIYVQEAQARYEQTRSFRHDARNHLLVLSELMRAGKTEKALSYLDSLEGLADALSFPCHTGNASVDALLGSKLAAAGQAGIEAVCSASIPKSCPVRDLDWCILLSNALDNAIKANGPVPPGQKQIRITGKQKGNLYLLEVENRCAQGQGIPEDGIGLSNIRSVVASYHGSVDIKAANGVFCLSLLLVISQPSKDLLRQIP